MHSKMPSSRHFGELISIVGKPPSPPGYTGLLLMPVWIDCGVSRCAPLRPLPDHHENNDRELIEPRDAIAERENWIEISAALADLPRDQREAIILVDVQDTP